MSTLHTSAPVRSILIPALTEHAGQYWMHATVQWTCIHCGGPRGEPEPGISWDGSRKLLVDTWRNPCGHVEKYSQVRDAIDAVEAMAQEDAS